LTRTRLLFAILASLALAAALAACGGGGGGGTSDPNQVLDQTFSSSNPSIKSADLTLKLDAKATGGNGGTVSADLSGPFQGRGSGQFPLFDLKLDLSAHSSGQNVDFSGGLISTGDAAFVNYQGSDYTVDPALFAIFSSAYQRSFQQQSQQGQSSGQLLARLGISNPKELLTNLKSEGSADVEGTTTDHISGDLNVDKLVESLKSVVSNASQLGNLPGISTQLPSAAKLDQLKGSIKTAHFDLYSGQSDHLIRRLTVDLSLVNPKQPSQTVSISFDLTLGGVNESQTINAPTNAKPLSALLKQLGISPSSLQALEALGGLSGGASGLPNIPSTSGGGKGAGTTTGASSGTTTVGGAGSLPSGGGTAKQKQAVKFLQCYAQAKTAAEIEKCKALGKGLTH